MAGPKKIKGANKNYGKIGYYGKPITDLSREELLAAIGELVDMYYE